MPQPYSYVCSTITYTWGQGFQMVAIKLPSAFFVSFYFFFVIADCIWTWTVLSYLDRGLLSMPKLGWIIQRLVQDQT